MNDHPENENDESGEPRKPMHAEFEHRAVTARVREEAGQGVFANAAIILSGRFEFVLDFILRMGKPDRVMTRVIMPVPVLNQFVQTLKESLKNYETQYGTVPELPKPVQQNHDEQPTPAKEAPPAVEATETPPVGFVGAIGPETVSSNDEEQARRIPPPIDDVYDELKLQDEMLGGAYANAVLIRHSPSEFCFDFVTNIYPRSSVNARVFMAIPQVRPLLNSMSHSYEQFQRRNNPPPPPPESDS